MLDQIMIDIETLGTGPDAAILAIGAVAFNFDLPDTECFYRRIKLESAMDHGGTVDASTIQWWMAQPEIARKELFSGEGQEIETVLNSFCLFINNLPITQIWANPPSFDLVILKSAADRVQIGMGLWNHRKERCYRTIAQTVGLGIIRIPPTIPHHALHDALAQTLHLKQIFASLPQTAIL